MRDAGLTAPTVCKAKHRLVKLGLITIDPCMEWRTDNGQFRSMADTVYLNLNFQVPAHLIERRRPRKSNGSVTVVSRYSSGTKKVDQAHLKSGPPGMKKVDRTPLKKWDAYLIEPLSEVSKEKPKENTGGACVPPAGVSLNANAAKAERRKHDLESINIEDRRRKLQEQAEAAIQAERTAS